MPPPGLWTTAARSKYLASIRSRRPSSLTVLAEYERAPSSVEALGALNRWPGRTGVPIEDYLREWEASCAELQASPALPKYLQQTLGIA